MEEERTVFLVIFGNLERVSATLNDIVVELDPQGQGGQSRARDVCDRTEVESPYRSIDSIGDQEECNDRCEKRE